MVKINPRERHLLWNVTSENENHPKEAKVLTLGESREKGIHVYTINEAEDLASRLLTS